jgi:aryl-alcohol dehydrogenase-like predicted oxidoreductase
MDRLGAKSFQWSYADMDYTTLGRTGLKVSVMGLGGGGPSRIGQREGKSEAESIALIRQAMDAGVNFIDTAEAYGTEEIVGKAIKQVERSVVVLSTKKRTGQGPITPAEVEQSLEASLKRLGVDYIDIYHLHGVVPADYDYLAAEIVPTLYKLRQQGKIGFIGLTERFNADPGHAMLQQALEDDIWDVFMVGFNLLNQSARERVFKKTIEKDIGILVMFAVRRALSQSERLKPLIQELIDKKQVNPADIDGQNPLGFLTHKGGGADLVDAAYRFCRYEAGVHVTLSGTGNPTHLRANLESFGRPPLPEADEDRLRRIFQQVDSVSGD